MADPVPSGDSLGFLKRKIGPVPIWVICVGVVAAYYWYMHYGPGAQKKAQETANAAAIDPATGQTYASELANEQDELNALQSTAGTTSGGGSSRWRNRGTVTSPVDNGTTPTTGTTTVTTPAAPVTTTPVVTASSPPTPVSVPPIQPAPAATVTVPNVEGMWVARAGGAEDVIDAAGLTYHTNPTVNPKNTYKVVSQTPAAGTKVAKGSRVDLGIVIVAAG